MHNKVIEKKEAIQRDKEQRRKDKTLARQLSRAIKGQIKLRIIELLGAMVPKVDIERTLSAEFGKGASTIRRIIVEVDDYLAERAEKLSNQKVLDAVRETDLLQQRYMAKALNCDTDKYDRLALDAMKHKHEIQGHKRIGIDISTGLEGVSTDDLESGLGVPPAGHNNVTIELVDNHTKAIAIEQITKQNETEQQVDDVNPPPPPGTSGRGRGGEE